MKVVAFCAWKIVLVRIERCGEDLRAGRNYSGIAAHRPPIFSAFRRLRPPFLEAHIMEFERATISKVPHLTTRGQNLIPNLMVYEMNTDNYIKTLKGK